MKHVHAQGARACNRIIAAGRVRFGTVKPRAANNRRRRRRVAAAVRRSAMSLFVRARYTSPHMMPTIQIYSIGVQQTRDGFFPSRSLVRALHALRV